MRTHREESMRKRQLLRALMLAIANEPLRPFSAARSYARGMGVWDSKKGEIEGLAEMTLSEVLTVFRSGETE